MTNHLTAEQLQAFETDGVIVLRSFFDVDQEIHGIQRGVYDIIGLLLRKYGLPDDRGAFSTENFDTGYQTLMKHDRKIGGEVYDAVKQIPAFMRFLAHPYLSDLVCQIRETTTPGIAAQGYGIRIDNPNEERFRSPWHQDYTSHLRSKDGLVFWSPLAAVQEDMGAVEFCLGSHKLGAVRVYDHDPNQPDKKGAYGMVLENEEQTIAKFETTAPLTSPGDLVIIDYTTIHRSGFNTSDRSRWSMQIRYFNYSEASGIAHGWSGGVVAGVPTEKIEPELLIKEGQS